MSSTRLNRLLSNEATRNNRFIQHDQDDDSPVPSWLIKLREERRSRLSIRSNSDLNDDDLIAAKSECGKELQCKSVESSNSLNERKSNANNCENEEYHHYSNLNTSSAGKKCLQNRINQFATSLETTKLSKSTTDCTSDSINSTKSTSCTNEKAIDNAKQQVVTVNFIQLGTQNASKLNKCRRDNLCTCSTIEPIDCSTDHSSVDQVNGIENVQINSETSSVTNSTAYSMKESVERIKIDTWADDESVRLINNLQVNLAASNYDLDTNESHQIHSTCLTNCSNFSKKLSQSNEMNAIEQTEGDLNAKKLTQLEAVSNKWIESETIVKRAQQSSLQCANRASEHCEINEYFINKYQGCSSYQSTHLTTRENDFKCSNDTTFTYFRPKYSNQTLDSPTEIHSKLDEQKLSFNNAYSNLKNPLQVSQVDTSLDESKGDHFNTAGNELDQYEYKLHNSLPTCISIEKLGTNIADEKTKNNHSDKQRVPQIQPRGSKKNLVDKRQANGSKFIDQPEDKSIDQTKSNYQTRSDLVTEQTESEPKTFNQTILEHTSKQTKSDQRESDEKSIEAVNQTTLSTNRTSSVGVLNVSSEESTSFDRKVSKHQREGDRESMNESNRKSMEVKSEKCDEQNRSNESKLNEKSRPAMKECNEDHNNQYKSEHAESSDQKRKKRTFGLLSTVKHNLCKRSRSIRYKLNAMKVRQIGDGQTACEQAIANEEEQACEANVTMNGCNDTLRLQRSTGRECEEFLSGEEEENGSKSELLLVDAKLELRTGFLECVQTVDECIQFNSPEQSSANTCMSRERTESTYTDDKCTGNIHYTYISSPTQPHTLNTTPHFDSLASVRHDVGEDQQTKLSELRTLTDANCLEPPPPTQLASLNSRQSSECNVEREQVSQTILPLNLKLENLETTNKVIVNRFIQFYHLLVHKFIDYLKSLPTEGDLWFDSTLTRCSSDLIADLCDLNKNLDTKFDFEKFEQLIRSNRSDQTVRKLVNLIKLLNHLLFKQCWSSVIDCAIDRSDTSHDAISNQTLVLISHLFKCDHQQDKSIEDKKLSIRTLFDNIDTLTGNRPVEHQCDLCNRNQLDHLINEYICALIRENDDQKYSIENLTNCLINSLNKFTIVDSSDKRLSEKNSERDSGKSTDRSDRSELKSTVGLGDHSEISEDNTITEDYCSLDSVDDLLTTTNIRALIKANNEQVELKFQSAHNLPAVSSSVESSAFRATESLVSRAVIIEEDKKIVNQSNSISNRFQAKIKSNESLSNLMNLKPNFTEPTNVTDIHSLDDSSVSTGDLRSTTSYTSVHQSALSTNEPREGSIRILNTKMASKSNLIFDELDELPKVKFDNSEIEYGPGIVDKLKSRFLQYQQLSSKYGNSSNGKLKRSSSLEDMLNCGMKNELDVAYNQINSPPLKGTINSSKNKFLQANQTNIITANSAISTGNAKYYTQQRAKQSSSSRHCNNKLNKLIIERTSHLETNTLNTLNVKTTSTNHFFKNMKPLKSLKNGSCSSSNSSSSSNNDDEEDDELDYFTLPVLKRAISFSELYEPVASIQKKKSSKDLYNESKECELEMVAVESEQSMKYKKMISRSMETLTMSMETIELRNHHTTPPSGQLPVSNDSSKCNDKYTPTPNFYSKAMNRFGRLNDELPVDQRKCNKQINKLNQQQTIKQTASSTSSSCLANNKNVTNQTVGESTMHSTNTTPLTQVSICSSRENNKSLTVNASESCLHTVDSAGNALYTIDDNQNISHNSNHSSTLPQINSNKGTLQTLLANNISNKLTNGHQCPISQQTAQQVNNNNHLNKKINQKEMISSQPHAQHESNKVDQSTRIKCKELAIEDELPKPNTVKLCKKIFEQQTVDQFSKAYHLPSNSVSCANNSSISVQSVSSGQSPASTSNVSSNSSLNYSKFKNSSLLTACDRSTGDKQNDNDRSNECLLNCRSTLKDTSSDDHESMNVDEIDCKSEQETRSLFVNSSGRKATFQEIGDKAICREICDKETLSNRLSGTLQTNAVANVEPLTKRSTNELKSAFDKLNQSKAKRKQRNTNQTPIVPPKPTHLLKQGQVNCSTSIRNEINESSVLKSGSNESSQSKEISHCELSSSVPAVGETISVKDDDTIVAKNDDSIMVQCDNERIDERTLQGDHKHLKQSTLTRKPCIYKSLKTTKPEIVRRKSIEREDVPSDCSSVEEDQYDDIRLDTQTGDQTGHKGLHNNQSVEESRASVHLTNDGRLRDNANNNSNSNLDCNLNNVSNILNNNLTKLDYNHEHYTKSVMRSDCMSNKLMNETLFECAQSWSSSEKKINNKHLKESNASDSEERLDDCQSIHSLHSTHSCHLPSLQLDQSIDSKIQQQSSKELNQVNSSIVNLSFDVDPINSHSDTLDSHLISHANNPNDHLKSHSNNHSNSHSISHLNSNLNSQQSVTSSTPNTSAYSTSYKPTPPSNSSSIPPPPSATNNNTTKENEMRSYTLPSFTKTTTTNPSTSSRPVSKITKKPVANIKPLIQTTDNRLVDLSSSTNKLKSNHKLNEQLNKLKDQLKDQLKDNDEKDGECKDSKSAKLSDDQQPGDRHLGEQATKSSLSSKKIQAPQPPIRQFNSSTREKNTSNQASISSISSNASNLSVSCSTVNSLDKLTGKQQVNDPKISTIHKPVHDQLTSSEDASSNQFDNTTDSTRSHSVNSSNDKLNNESSNSISNSSSLATSVASSLSTSLTSYVVINKKKVESTTSNVQAGGGSSSVVFDFRGTNVKANVKVRSSNSVIRSTSNQDEDDDFNYTGITQIPEPSGVVFDGENVLLEKSSLLATRNKKLKIKFNEDDDDVFEYPSEAFMLKTYDCHNDLQNGFKSTDNEEETDEKQGSSDERPMVRKRSKNTKLTPTINSTNTSLKNNTIIGALNGNLSSYKPNSLSSNFELGITRRVDDKASKSSGQQEISLPDDEFQTMLKPASSNETKSFSISTKASDLLF